MNDIMGHYRPEFMPGGASRDRPDIARPTQQSRTTSLSAIESHIQAIRSNSRVLSLDPALKTFFDVDLPKLMAIARAADRWAFANQAEVSRAAAGDVHAAVRSIG